MSFVLVCDIGYQMVGTPSFAALKQVSDRLKEANIDHALGGTGLLFALGLIGEVHDWDITVEAPLELIEPMLAGLIWEPVGPSEAFSSDFLIRIFLEGAVIEIISGFTILRSGQKHRIPFSVAGQWKGVPLANPKTWQKAYELMGQIHKSKALANHLES